MMTTIEQVGWSMADDERIWKNTRDFAPSCRKCNGNKTSPLPWSVGQRGQILHKAVCLECQGTGADTMPWSELFRESRLR